MAVEKTPKELSLGYSPCPNDTFIFHRLVSGDISVGGFRIREQLHDVETLNKMAFDRRLDITKLSFYAYLAVKKHYRLLQSGGALGYGCGPLLVAGRSIEPNQLAECTVVIPGRWTTAHLLFQLWAPKVKEKIFTSYDQVFDILTSGQADCGVIIHESRFTYQKQGLVQVVDLGAWWEKQTGLPVPLGCIAVLRRHPKKLALDLEKAIVESIKMARSNPEAVLPYIRKHAQEIDQQVLLKHIKTFVNQFSLDLGRTGLSAVEALEARARLDNILK